MFASKTSTTLGIISLILLSIYDFNANADTCSDVKAKSEVARVSAENACATAAEIAINSAEPTKAVAKKACDDAKIIAKNVADIAAAAVCPLETSTQLQQNVTSEATSAVEAQTKGLPEVLKATTNSVVESEINSEEESNACISVKAKSEAARVSAEQACAKAAQVAINSAAPTKAVAKKACDDAKIIAKNVADKAAAAVCPAPSMQSYQNVSEVAVGAQTKPLPEVVVTPTNSNVESDACISVKAKSEAARVSAENACAKAAQVAINSAAPTKTIAKKACDDAKIIAKNVADKAAAAVCPATTTTTTTTTTVQSNQQILEAQAKHALSLIRKILIFLRMV